MSDAKSWLDDDFGPPVPRYADVDLPVQPSVEYKGAGVSVADDPTNKRTVVTIPGVLIGEATIDMGDADYVALPAEYAAGIIVNGDVTPQTAPRTLTLPNATDAAAYCRLIKNTNVDDLVVQDVAAGASVTVASGTGRLVGIHAAGAFVAGSSFAL